MLSHKKGIEETLARTWSTYHGYEAGFVIKGYLDAMPKASRYPRWLGVFIAQRRLSYLGTYKEEERFKIKRKKKKEEKNRFDVDFMPSG